MPALIQAKRMVRIADPPLSDTPNPGEGGAGVPPPPGAFTEQGKVFWMHCHRYWSILTPNSSTFSTTVRINIVLPRMEKRKRIKKKNTQECQVGGLEGNGGTPTDARLVEGGGAGPTVLTYSKLSPTFKVNRLVRLPDS